MTWKAAVSSAMVLSSCLWPNPRTSAQPAGQQNTAAVASTSLVGRWRSLETSSGGIGSILELRKDGSATISPGAVVEGPYRLEGSTLVLAERQTGADTRLRVEFAGDDTLMLQPIDAGARGSGLPSQPLTRVGPRLDGKRTAAARTASNATETFGPEGPAWCGLCTEYNLMMSKTHFSMVALIVAASFCVVVPAAVHARSAQGGQTMLPAPPDVAKPPADAQKTASGLAYKVLQPGEGTTHPTATSSVTVHYTGWTTDGQMFDSSVARNQPATFPLNRVIAGWTEGVQLMVEGEKTRFWIPGNLAYDNSSRPGAPKGMLVFDIELISIK